MQSFHMQYLVFLKIQANICEETTSSVLEKKLETFHFLYAITMLDDNICQTLIFQDFNRSNFATNTNVLRAM